MILQSLTKYGEELRRQGKLDAEGWCGAKTSYALTIDGQGRLRNIMNLQKEEMRGKKKALVPVIEKVPAQKARSSNISPNFMCDNAKYLLGAWKETERAQDNEKAEKNARQCFAAAAKLHLELLNGIEDSYAKSICRFFQTWDFAEKKEEITVDLEGLLAAANLVFRSFETGEMMLESSGICDAWEAHYRQSLQGEEGFCLVTGKHAPVARLHMLIKGLRGAQSSGASLVSFNAPAFESYGKTQGENAPVSEYAVSAYGNALNYLLSHREHYRIMGDTTVLFWAENAEDAYADLMGLMFDDIEESMEIKLLEVMDQIVKGRKCRYEETELESETGFCILGLSPNAARISVRFFYKDTFGNLVRNINAHYRRLEIVSPSFEKKQYPSIGNILYETVNKNATKKQAQPALVGALMRAVLQDTRYPAAVYSHLLIRIRADKNISRNRNRAAMIKAYLIKNYPLQKEVVDSMELNEQTENAPYVLGRIFAVLEQAQDAVNPDLKATIRDRYFNAACTTPAAVFPRLMRLKNHHMRVLAREKKGLQISLEKQLGDLFGKLHEELPRRLSLEEQGVFMIGYYHQTQKRFGNHEEKIRKGQEKQV